nr:hypothetical protein [Tanacetum cinerariifolium]
HGQVADDQVGAAARRDGADVAGVQRLGGAAGGRHDHLHRHGQRSGDGTEVADGDLDRLRAARAAPGARLHQRRNAHVLAGAGKLVGPDVGRGAAARVAIVVGGKRADRERCV